MAYEVPAAADLKLRYPAFTAVDDATVDYWINDAKRSVDTSWGAGDYPVALMALAAHNMTLAGLGADAASLTGVPAGINRMKSGSLELGFTDAAANARMTGDLTATRYGQEYQLLLRRNRGGPVVSSSGSIPIYPATFDYPLGYPV